MRPSCQSLVANGSFELLTTCPKYIGDIACARGWHNGNLLLTPDLFSTCTNVLGNAINVPDNYVGSIQPVDGTCYAGLVLFTQQPQLSKKQSFLINESIWTKLTIPVQPANKYSLTVKAALADSARFMSRCITATLSKSPFTKANDKQASQVVTLLIATNASVNKSTWQSVSVTFTAGDKWEYLSIGLSRSVFTYQEYILALTQKLDGHRTRSDCYYYLDDITLKLVP